MGAIVFSSFSSLSPDLLPVCFSHYMFVQYLAQWDPVLVQDLGELHNTKAVLMREIINLTGRKKKGKNSCHFCWNSNNDQLGATEPQVIHGARKTRSKFFTAGLQTRCALGFIFKQQQPPLQRSQVLSAFWGGGKEKDTFFSEIWHSQFLALSFSSSRGYLTFSECSWAG